MPEQANSPPAQGWTEARHSSSSSTSSSLKRRQEDGGSPEGSQGALNDLSRGGFPIYNKKRKNTTRACDACKKRKVKCDGMQPCERCIKGGGDCTYNVKYTRGVFVAPLRNENLQHELSSPAQSSQLARLMDAVAAVSKTEIPTMLADISKLDKALNNDNDAQLSPSSARVSDEQPADQEDEGESFLGGSSNLVYSHSAKAHLLDEVQVPASPRNVPEQSQHRSLISSSTLRFSPSSRDHFWFAERPVEEVDARLLALPSRKLSLQLVEWYFDNSSPTYRILHRPTVEHWIDSGFHSTQSEFDPVSHVNTEPVPTTRRCECDAHHPNPFEDRSICALMFSVWAMGSRFPVGIKPGSKESTLLQRRGEQYFSIAEKELQQEKSLIDRLTSLQAKFIMCQYLLTTSRVKASWDLLSSVKNMANNLDLNRRNFRSPSSPADSLYIELRKRAFWAIYTLDTYMCTMIGKSLMLSDEDITVELPEPVGDLSEVGEPTQLHTPLEHAKLSRILRVALRKLYSDIPLKSEELVTVTGQLGKMLQEWEDGLPQLLRRESSSGLTLPYSRQVDVIKMAHCHALIMIYRPSLNFETSSSESLSDHIAENIRQQQEKCLEAALAVASNKGLDDLNGSYWFIAYILFCAVTVMFVYLSKHPDSPRSSAILHAATKVCILEKEMARESYMARRYVAALSELWTEVRKLLAKKSTLMNDLAASIDNLYVRTPKGMEDLISPPVAMSRQSELSQQFRELELALDMLSSSEDQRAEFLQHLRHHQQSPSCAGGSTNSCEMCGSKPVDMAGDEGEKSAMAFDHILSSLAQSFRGFDSTASTGIGMF